jgi:hypothetical protein
VIEEAADLNEASDLGLHITPAYRVYEWSENGYKVFFSATQQGNAMVIHIAAPIESKRCLRISVEDFCEFVYSSFPWCEVIMGAIIPASVVNLAKKCGFIHIADALIGEEPAEGKIMARFRQ